MGLNMVAITGGCGAGKTLMAAHLAELISVLIPPNGGCVMSNMFLKGVTYKYVRDDDITNLHQCIKDGLLIIDDSFQWHVIGGLLKSSLISWLDMAKERNLTIIYVTQRFGWVPLVIRVLTRTIMEVKRVTGDVGSVSVSAYNHQAETPMEYMYGWTFSYSEYAKLYDYDKEYEK